MESTPLIPDHQLLRRIGKGAYGEVWLAKNVTGAYRAVKIVYRSSFDHDRPYEREFSGMQKYEPVSRTHETQVAILHIGRNDTAGYFYYIMEVADDRLTGQDINPENYEPWTLRGYLYQNGRLPIEECEDIAIHLATALDHIHKQGLVHRDVKPSNIIFIKQVPKLADIGLVSATNDERSFVGTEGYIPPEGPGSPQADIYSLGKVLYEISTGRNRLDFPELPTLLKDLPEREALVQFNDIVLRACEDDPKNRYHSAEEMLADLWKLKLGEPIGNGRSRGGAKRLFTATLLAGISVAALFGGARFYPYLRSRWRAHYSSESTAPNESESVASAQSTRDPALKDGLLAWWKADGDASDSAGTNNGTLMKGAGFGDGKIGHAFLLNVRSTPDGVYTPAYSDYVSVPNSSAWTFGKNDFSIELWANFAAAASDEHQTFLASDDGAGHLNKWVFWMHYQRLAFHVLQETSGGIELSPRSKFDPIPGRWYHLAITRGNSILRFYIDGAEVWSEPWAGYIPPTVAPLTIGRAESGFYFHGRLDDIRIYNRALSPDEIRATATGLQPDAETPGTSARGANPNPNLAVIYQTDFGSQTFQPGPLAGQDGWGIDSGVSKNAANIVPSTAGQRLLISGLNLEHLSNDNYADARDAAQQSSGATNLDLLLAGNDYEMRYTRELNLPSNTGRPQRIELSADMEANLDPNAARLDFHEIGFGLVLPGGSVTNVMRLGRWGRLWVDTYYPEHHSHNGAGGFPTHGFHRFSLDCDLQSHLVAYSLDGHSICVLPFPPACDTKGAFAYFTFSASKPNSTTLAVTNFVVIAYSDASSQSQATRSNSAENLKDGLVSRWNANSNALDSMHNNDGTISGDVEFADGPCGKAFVFNGGHVEIPDSPSLRFSSPFSLSLWMKVPGYRDYLAAIITKGDHSWRLQRDFNGHSVLFSITGVNHSTFNGHPPVDLPAMKIVDDGQWHHVAAIYSGDHEALYIDGTLDVSVPCSGFPAVDHSPVFFGKNSQGAPRVFNGEISDVRIYDHALSAEAIKALAAGSHLALTSD